MPKQKRQTAVTELIADGLCRLIERGEKPYSALTVQDIVDEAGVCRNSFYRNYTSKDDIFLRRLMELSAGEKTERAEKNARGFTFYDIFADVALLMQSNRRFFLCFYRADAKAYFDTITAKIIDSNTPDSIETVPPKDYYTYACRAWIGIGVLTEWLKRDCDLPADSLVEVLEGISL